MARSARNLFSGRFLFGPVLPNRSLLGCVQGVLKKRQEGASGQLPGFACVGAQTGLEPV